MFKHRKRRKNMKNLDYFIRYVRVSTQSDDTTGTTPSTERQKNLGRMLVKDLQTLGVADAHMDEWGNVYGHLPGQYGERIGFNAHMDTALEVSGENVQPHLVKNYQGNVIKLANGLEMSPKAFPSLKKHIGHDLIVTDGNTLLGADDKSGLAIIMSVVKFFHDHPEVKHHTLCIGFTVDEEIGEGALHFDYKKMGADYAYTIDGAAINIVECENFNAKEAEIFVKGVSIHPGEGKGKLVNAGVVINSFLSELPAEETPFDSEGHEGFWHLTEVKGTPDNAYASIILRDFDVNGINHRVKILEDAVRKTQEKYPTAEVELKIRDQYYNMKQYVDKNPYVVNKAVEVIRSHGLEPVIGFIRGGTDGATMSRNGLITPNLGTGSYNHHGRFEYLDVQEFEQIIKIVTDICRQ